MTDDLAPFLESRDDPVLSGDFGFETDEFYIFRFVVRSFFKERPKTGAASFLISLASFLSEDLTGYYILGVTLQKIEPFKEVKIHDKSLIYATADRSVLTDEATWVLDVVVRPAANERAWTNPDQWSDRVASALQGWGGYKPVVNIVGVVTLPIRWYMSDTAHFNHVRAWWDQRQPVYYVQACLGAQLTNPEFKGKCPQVSFAPFNATSYTKGLVGEDGLGFAQGLADYPDTLQPINIKDAATVPGGLLPGSQPGGGGSTGNGKETPPGPGPAGGGQPMPKANQYLIFGAFAALGYVLYQKMFKDVF